jgi:uncharacterized integral membrane protein
MRRLLKRSADDAAAGAEGKAQRREAGALIGLGLLVAFVVAFVIENSKRISVHFVFGTARTRVIWLILLSLALGLIAGLLLPQLGRRRRRKQSR